MTESRFGFIGLVGPTNSGKSTLLNALIGQKISIVSPKPQTTYHGIRGILTKEHFQMVVTDTPGFQAYPESIARLLNKVASKNAEDSDFLVWVFDVSEPRMERQLERLLPQMKRLAEKDPERKPVLVLNKVDKIDKRTLLPMIQRFFDMGIFSEIIPLSARKGVGVDSLLRVLEKHLPKGEPMYDKDMVTDRSANFRMCETVREKIYQVTRQEIPYSVYLELEDETAAAADVQDAITEGDEVQEKKSAGKHVPVYRIVIHVDSQSRKGILIGKGGEVLKKIGTAARKEIEEFLGQQVCLKLFVHVDPNWREDRRRVDNYLELAE